MIAVGRNGDVGRYAGMKLCTTLSISLFSRCESKNQVRLRGGPEHIKSTSEAAPSQLSGYTFSLPAYALSFIQCRYRQVSARDSMPGRLISTALSIELALSFCYNSLVKIRRRPHPAREQLKHTATSSWVSPSELRDLMERLPPNEHTRKWNYRVCIFTKPQEAYDL